MTIPGANAPANNSSAAQPSPQRTSSADQTLAFKDTFLRLLVAQMRNQDPLRPTDSVQFLSQLAQFSSLEQSVQLNQEVVGVRKAIEDLLALVQNQQSIGDPLN